MEPTSGDFIKPLIMWAALALLALLALAIIRPGGGISRGDHSNDLVCPANSSSDLSYCEVDDTYYPEYPEADY